MSYTYLASPYSHPDPAVREERYRSACEAAALLMQLGEIVFCPIAHSHPVAEHLPAGCAIDHDFWLRQDGPLLGHCDRVFVLMIDGWSESSGVRHEIEHAIEHDVDLVWGTLEDLRARVAQPRPVFAGEVEVIA